jgi:polysaccharide chain length determinant protein (PEP-CTERM system associated)
MSVEFRKRTNGEYLEILKRRKWEIILPTIAFLVAVGWVVMHMPSMYESTALLTLQNPIISEKVAPSLTDADLSRRVQTMSQSILSRTSLEPLVEKYNLFQEEQANGVAMEEILVRMRKNINVEFEKVDQKQIAGFRITYKDRDAVNAQKVTQEIANRFIATQMIESEQSAETTSAFLDNQLSEAKNNLDSIDQERIAVMTQNVQTLPDSAQGLIAQLDGLRKREETISKDKETLINERSRLRDNIQSLNNQMRLIADTGEKETQEAVSQASRIEDTPAYGQLIQRRAELNARFENLKKQYRDKHPDVVQAQIDIDKINDELQQLSKGTAQRAKLASQSAARKTDLQKKSLEIEKEKSESQIGQIEQQLQMKDEEMQRNSVEIGTLEAKINGIPGVRVTLEGINNRYQSAKIVYDDLLKKYNAAQGQVDRETNHQGETIRLVDAANLPEMPTNASKRPIYILIGGAAGLALGLFFAGIYEVPRLFRVQSIEDAKHYTGLPVLASIPNLLSEVEIARQERNRRIRVFAGTVFTLIAIPVLTFVLQMSRLFERLS